VKKDKKKESWFANFVNNTFTKKEILEEVAPTQEEQRRAVLDREKEEATKAGKSWVAVLDTQVNPDNIKNGFFELDWNNQFIEELLDAGYSGETSEAIVDAWFKSIVVQMLEEEGESTDRDMGHIKIVPKEDGKSEVS
jgi:NADH:ubiquinone oxidoreductase subunit